MPREERVWAGALLFRVERNSTLDNLKRRCNKQNHLQGSRHPTSVMSVWGLIYNWWDCLRKLGRNFKKMKTNLYGNRNILFAETNNEYYSFFFEITHVILAKNRNILNLNSAVYLATHKKFFFFFSFLIRFSKVNHMMVLWSQII